MSDLAEGQPEQVGSRLKFENVVQDELIGRAPLDLGRRGGEREAEIARGDRDTPEQDPAAGPEVRSRRDPGTRRAAAFA